jgi:hypothetical protein
MLKKVVIITTLFSFVLQGCYKDIVKDNNPTETFEVFWNTLNERYVYFNEKHINWDSIYNVYHPKINQTTTENELKQYLQDIMVYMKDGHVSIQTDLNEYFYASTIPKRDYFYSSSIQYYSYFYLDSFDEPFFSLQLNNDITYCHVTNFTQPLSLSVIKEALGEKKYKNGIIIDMRGNNGGFLNNALDLFSLFSPNSQIAGYVQNKTGSGWDSFGEFTPIVVNGCNLIPQNIKKVVLTNAVIFSAGNAFCYFIRTLPNTIIVGTRSSGGGGSPINVLLPNNWILFYPANKYFNSNYESTESGINPDIEVNTPEGYWIGDLVKPDPVIDKALEYLKEHR